MQSAAAYLLVNAGAKYWRLDYRLAEKRKTLALGVYPAVTLAKARHRRDKARELLADGIDPSVAKREEKGAQALAAANTFEAVARPWLAKTAANRAASTKAKITNWLDYNVFPAIGKMPISAIGPRDMLAAVRKMEDRGAIDSAHRVKQICGQVLRYAVAAGLADRDVTADLKGALAAVPSSHFAAIIEPKQAGDLMRSIFAYSGHPSTVAALELPPLVFVRPGELRTAEWAEFNLEAAEWRIPGSKMKMKVDHVVPLSRQAVAVLRGIHPSPAMGAMCFKVCARASAP